jgi:eukaryotic-like serine/threonine-protein kinase
MQATKAENRVCARCGAALKRYALGRLCPGCMLKAGLHEPGDGAATVNAPPGTCDTCAAVPQLSQGFGDYELLEIIARGGMGIVYKARQKSLNRIVAVKMLLSGQFSEPKFVKRFRAEAEAVAQLQHPNIVAIHEIGECEGQPFFSMDYVEGKNLAQMTVTFGSSGLEMHRCANWLKAISEAVHYAHERGIIHRDLKPSNVLIDAFDRPRITDFGLAKRLTEDSDLTLSGQVLGSPNYLPPEQADPKHGTPGPASDVYALGAILYHLITGRPPFQADSLTTLLRQVIETEPVAPRSLNPSIPHDLETICLKCLEKDPSRRYYTARALGDDLQRYLEGKPILAKPPGLAGKVMKWCRRQPALAALVAALFLTFVAGLAGVLWQVQRARAGELAARRNAYAADMNLAQAAAESGDLRATKTLLDAQRPVAGEKDLRGWEWRHLWQLCGGQELFELTRSIRGIDRLGFSPAEAFLAVREGQTNLALWNLETRQRVWSYRTRGSLDAFGFSPDGTLLAHTPAGPPSLSIVSVQTGEELARLPDNKNLASVGFSSDGRRVFTYGLRGNVTSVTGWDIASKKVVWNWTNSPSSVARAALAAAFSPEVGLLAYCARRGVGLCALDSGGHSDLRFSGIEGSPTALTFSADGKLLAAAVGNEGSEVYVWSVESLLGAGQAMPEPVRRVGKHRDAITALAFSPDARAVVSASADATLGVWELDGAVPGRRYQGHTHQVLAVAWSPDGKYVVSGGADGSVRVWDPWKEPAASAPAIFPSPHWNFYLSADGKRALSLDATDYAAVVWDTVNQRRIEKLDFAGINLDRVTWSPDGRLMAAVEAAGNVRIWDLVQRRAITNLVIEEYQIIFPDFSPNGKFLFCGGVGRTQAPRRKLGVWQVNGWRRVQLPADTGTWAACSPDCRNLVLLLQDGTLELWDIANGRLRRRESQPSVGGDREGIVAFSHDGRTWASSTPTGVVCLWDTAGKHERIDLPSTMQELWNLSFSADDTRLLLSGKRASDVVRFFDPLSRRVVGTLAGPPDRYWYVRISSDNSTVVAAAETTALVWRAPSWAQIEAAEKGER